MTRKYIALSDDPRPLAFGDYILRHDVLLEDAETGEIEMLLVITDTRLRGPERTKARYVAAGEHIEIDATVSFHFFVGSEKRIRAAFDLPDDMTITRLTAPPADKA